MPIPFCEHVMSSGIRCGSPAQRGQKYCFYHGSVRTLLPKRFIGHERFRNEYEHGCRLFPMPLLEDATSIQTALMQVIHATLEGAIHFRSASIVPSALRTAQRNLAVVKLEMAATSSAALERELPSDAGQKAEVTFPNRAEDQWPTSYAGEATVSPAHLNGDLGYREPKIPPHAEDEDAGQEGAVAVPQGDDSSTTDDPDTLTAARLAARRAARPSTNSNINGMGRLPGTEPSVDTPPAEGAPPFSPAVGERLGRGPGSDASVLPFRKQPETVRGNGSGEQPETRQEGQTPTERSD